MKFTKRLQVEVKPVVAGVVAVVAVALVAFLATELRKMGK